MSVLGGTLELHDVGDVEKFAQDALARALGGMGATLNATETEDALTFLISTAWELGQRYDPAKSPNGQSFSTYAGRLLPLRVSSWYRIRFNGSDRARRDRPELLSLDAPIGRGDDGEPGGSRLGDTLASSTGDPAADRSPALVRVLEGGDRCSARAGATVGEQAAVRATAGARMASVRSLPAVPPTFRMPRVRPSCAACAKGLLRRLRADADGQRTDAELRAEAAEETKMVAVGEDWLCPNCATVPTATGPVPLKSVLPNRAARRQAVRQR